jgi:hypothetical protein
MLRSFQLANHKSIRVEQELALLPTYDRSTPVVPVAAIYGANASGKSNLLDALLFMQSAVRSSFGQWEAETGVPRSAFRLDLVALSEPSTFVVDVVVDGTQYVYGFSVDDARVLQEWLYAYKSSRRTVVFERDGLGVTLGDSLPERRSRTKALRAALRDNALLLSTAMQLGEQPEVVPVYRWFRDGLFSPKGDPIGTRQVLAGRVELAMVGHQGFLDLVRAADMDIVDVRVEETEVPLGGSRRAEVERVERELADLAGEVHGGEADMSLMRRRVVLENWLRQLGSPRTRRELVFLQGPNAVPMTVEDQSAGTIAYLNLVADALAALRTGACMAVDEIDMSLHPRLTARLIELFRAKATNPRSAQLIFTTHDATLLGTSFGAEVLGRDEIWFVEKRDGATVLYPLTDFHPRNEENRERRYLGGSYGAVPAVFPDTLVDSLRQVRSEPADAAS